MVTTSTVPVRLQNIFHELPGCNTRIPLKLLHEMGFVRPPQGKGDRLEMIRSGELPSYHRKGDEKKKKPRVWLNKADVDRMYKSYTLRKGKEKKI